MPSHVDPPRSLGNRIFQAFWLSVFGFRALGRAITLWPLYLGKWPFKRLVLVSLLRQVGPLEHPRDVMPALTTGEGIRLWAQDHTLEHTNETIPVPSEPGEQPFPDVTLHTISLKDSTSSPKVVFYIHGGGFRSPLNPKGQLPAIVSIAKTLRVSKVHIPEYNLAPMDTYPTQPAQIYTAIQQLISQGTRLKDIILIGDSAGGTLSLSLLAHILQPAPFYPAFTDVNPGDRFHATLLISPYVRFHPTTATLTPSWISNAKFDYVSHESELRFQQWYQPKGEVWAEPAHSSVASGFWSDIPSRSVTIVLGEWENFRDDIIAFGKRMEKDTRGGKGVEMQMLVAEKAVHVETALDAGLGYEDGAMTKILHSWAEGLRSE